MAVPEAWHEDLPQLLDQQGFQKQYGNTVIRSNNDVGPQKTRRRTTRPRDMYMATMTISDVQEPIFWQFFNTTLNGGATTFYFDDPITNLATEWRFASEPTITLKGFKTYVIQMQWEKMGAYVG